MQIGFGATKCMWMVTQTSSKSSQYTLAFVCFRECSISSSEISFEWICVFSETTSTSDLASLIDLRNIIALVANYFMLPLAPFP